MNQNNKTSILTPQLPKQPSSQKPHTKLIPIIKIPTFTNNNIFSKKSHKIQKSPQQNSFLNTITTINQKNLNNLNITLSPLLSPLKILFSPKKNHQQNPTNTIK